MWTEINQDGSSVYYQVGTNKKINVTNYNKINIYMYAPSSYIGGNQIYWGLYNKKSTGYQNTTVENSKQQYDNNDLKQMIDNIDQKTSENIFVITLDTSSLGGEYYLAMYGYVQDYEIGVYRVEMIPEK